MAKIIAIRREVFSSLFKDSEIDTSSVIYASPFLILALLSLLSIYISTKVIFTFFGLVIITTLFSPTFITAEYPCHYAFFLVCDCIVLATIFLFFHLHYKVNLVLTF